MAHYCISNPCWICYPEYAPKQDDKHFTWWNQEIEDHKIPQSGVSGIVRRLLVAVFDQGLDEDTHLWTMPNLKLKLEDIKKEREQVVEGSLEAELLDLLINDLSEEDID